MNPPETDLAVKNKLKLKELCSQCGQPLPEKNKGTITGWIFDNEYKALTEKWVCRCGKEDESSQSEFKRPSQSDLKILSQADLARSQQSDLSKRAQFGRPSQTDLESPSLSGMQKLPRIKNTAPMDMPVDSSNRKSIALPVMPPFEVLEDRWRLIEPIGTGQLGATYKAISVEEAREVVVKILNSEIAANPRMAKRFLQECKKAASLHRENVAAIYDYGRLPDGRPYVVSEYCPTTLASTLDKEGFLDVDDALKLADELCDGLNVAHQAEIIHRGLKPENVMFLNDVAKLADVGVAKALPGAGREAMDLTATSYVFGDPVYTSPEQCQGFRVDERSDIYSLGGVLYHALTGKRPFGSKKGIQLALAQLGETPRSFDRVMFNCDIPQDVERLVMRCLEKDPLLRYQSINSLQQDIKTLRSGKKLKGGFAAPVTPFVVPLHLRHKAKSAGILALAAAMIIPALFMVIAMMIRITGTELPSTDQRRQDQPAVSTEAGTPPKEEPPPEDKAKPNIANDIFNIPKLATTSAPDLETEQMLKHQIGLAKNSDSFAGEQKAITKMEDLVHFYENHGRWAEADAQLNQVIDSIHREGVAPSIARYYLELANNQYQIGDLNRARGLAETALANRPDRIDRAKACTFLGQLALQETNFKSAQLYFQSAVDAADSDTWERAHAQGLLAYAIAKDNGLTKAEADFHGALDSMQNFQQKEQIAFQAAVRYAFGSTVANSETRDEREAIGLHTQAKRLLEGIGAGSWQSPYNDLYKKVCTDLGKLQTAFQKLF